MVKIKLALTFFMLLALNMHAQLSTFDLQDYKVPDYKLRSLSGFINSSGYTNTSVENDVKYQRNRLNGQLDLFFNFEKNNRKIQSGSSILLSLNPEISRDYLDNNLDYKRNAFNSKLFINAYNRNYYHPKRFIELRADINTGYEGDQYGVALESSSSTFDYEVSGSIQHGHGRVENVTQAWKAFRMIEDIQKNNLGATAFSDEEIVELADLLTARLKTRWFDRRYKKIEDIELIAAFFKDKAIEDNSRLMTSIYDMFDYGINSSRYSGYRFSYGVKLTDEYYIKRFSDDFDFSDHPFSSLLATINYVYHKPLNLKWQMSAGIGFEYGLINDLIIESDNDLSRFVFNGSVGYFPTSRTYFISNISTGLSATSLLDDDRKNTTYLSINNNLYYYFSPQLRLNANLSFRSQNDWSNDSVNRLSYSVGVGYTFF